jgi:hypothetical protein
MPRKQENVAALHPIDQSARNVQIRHASIDWSIDIILIRVLLPQIVDRHFWNSALSVDAMPEHSTSSSPSYHERLYTELAHSPFFKYLNGEREKRYPLENAAIQCKTTTQSSCYRDVLVRCFAKSGRKMTHVSSSLVYLFIQDSIESAKGH